MSDIAQGASLLLDLRRDEVESCKAEVRSTLEKIFNEKVEEEVQKRVATKVRKLQDQNNKSFNEMVEKRVNVEVKAQVAEAVKQQQAALEEQSKKKMDARISRYNTRIDNLSDTVGSLKEKVNERNREIVVLQSQNKDLARMLAKAQAELAKNLGLYAKLYHEISNFTDQLAKTTNTERDLRKQNATLARDLANGEVPETSIGRRCRTYIRESDDESAQPRRRSRVLEHSD